MSTQLFLDKTILVTGASSGLGLHFCKMLMAKGAQVIGVSRRAPPAGVVSEFIEADLKDPGIGRRIEFKVAYKFDLPSPYLRAC